MPHEFYPLLVEILDKPRTPLIPEEDQAIVAEQQALLSPDNPVVVYEHRVILPGEQIRWQQWSDRALFAQAGNSLTAPRTGDQTEPAAQLPAHAFQNPGFDAARWGSPVPKIPGKEQIPFPYLALPRFAGIGATELCLPD